jgi:hypothetical protein
MEQITNRNHQTIRTGLVLLHWLFSVTVVTPLFLSSPSPSFTTNRRFGDGCSYYNYNRHCSMSVTDGMEDEPTTMGQGECLIPVMPGSKDQQRTINEGEVIARESGRSRSTSVNI